MEKDLDIESLTEELRNQDPLYAFLPDDVEEKFFIGEAIILAASGVFVAGFLTGVNNVIKERGQKLGEAVANWVAEKIGGLFKKPSEAKAEQIKAEKEIEEQSKIASRMDEKTLNLCLDATEEAFEKTLRRRGLTEKKAIAIAKKTRKAAETKILKSGGIGTQRR